mmetsp:Transcript_30349/g.46549  ORF Transcript_30349/g.46549 Transcript_30349/m.46549 type:complete len:344 (-) Transcript_30349:168-1199(-)
MNAKQPMHIPPNFKGVFAGSGRDALSSLEVVNSILDLTEKNPSEVNVVYLGTATYDLPQPKEKQTFQFVKAGCNVQYLDVVEKVPSRREVSVTLNKADVIVVSGGNTLYAVDRWKLLDIDEILRKAMHRGAVLAGGSAGAICWFQSGHSDSADPETYRRAMVEEAVAEREEPTTTVDSSGSIDNQNANKKDWEYIKVEGLGFLPGLICPHHDKVQSNGILRANDFDSMLLRHPTELGICIDHFAALEVHGSRYRVISLKGKEGSVLQDGTFSPDRQGKPGVWLKEVMQGEIQMTLCPQEGDIKKLLRAPTSTVHDPRVDICRKENPDEGEVPGMLSSDGPDDS